MIRPGDAEIFIVSHMMLSTFSCLFWWMRNVIVLPLAASITRCPNNNNNNNNNNLLAIKITNVLQLSTILNSEVSSVLESLFQIFKVTRKIVFRIFDNIINK